MTIKEKYELIDKTKVSAKVLEILEKMEKASSNFTNAEVNSRVDTALDKIIEGLKVSKPEALLSVSDAKKEVKKEKKEAEEKNKGKDLSKKKDTDDKTGLPKKDTIEERKDIIKKESESEKEARERAKKELEKENEKAKDVIESQLEKLNRIILEDPALRGFNTGTSATGGGKSTPLIDAERKAIPRGRRVSQKGRKNQYGASAGGRVYWENRENRSDRKSPDYPTGKPYLAKGGMTENKTDVIKLYYHETSGGAEYLCSSKVKGSKDEGSFDSEYVVRIDGATDFGGELRIRKGGDIKRIILYYHETSGGAEYLCSSKVKGSKGEGSFDSEFVVRIDGATDFGGELRISNMSGNKLAKGGNVYSSDDLYEVKMVQDGVELDSKLIRAKNKGEARMIFEDMYQEKYQDEFGEFDLEIDVAKSRLPDGGKTEQLYSSIKRDRLRALEDEISTVNLMLKKLENENTEESYKESQNLREYKTILVKKLNLEDIEYDKGGEMADGGMMADGDEIKNLIGKEFRPLTATSNNEYDVKIVNIDFDNVTYKHKDGQVKKSKTSDFLDSYIQVKTEDVYMAKGGSVLESGYYAYPSGDEGNELGVFKDKESMISFALANKDKYRKLIFEGIENDDILEVKKGDSKDVITWVFSRLGMDRKEANKKIKMWFISNYPADEEEAKQIDESVTFDDIWFDLKDRRGIYNRLRNPYVVREVFQKIASIYGVEYDFVEKMHKRESYAKGGYMEHRGTITDDSLESILKSDFPKSNYQLDHDNISGHKIYGQKDVIKTIQKHLLTEYGIKSEYYKEGFGLPFLTVYSQFVDKYAQGGYMADGGETDGNVVQYGDKVIITTDDLGEKYKGMQGEIMPTQLSNDKYSIKLENGLTMTFDKGEFRHNSIYPKYTQGGYMADGGEVGNWRGNALGDGSIELINSGVYIRDNTGNYGRGRYDVYKRGDYDWRTSSTGVTLLASFDDLEEAKQYGYNNNYAKGGMMANGGGVEFDMEDDAPDYNSISDLEEEYRRLVRWSNQYGSKGADAKIEQLKKRIEYLKSHSMARGGYMADGENYEYVNTFKRFDSDVPVPQDDFEKLVDAYHKQLSGDKLAVVKYNVLKVQMGNYLGEKTVEEMEEYIQKTHEAHKMAHGGEVGSWESLTIEKMQKDFPFDLKQLNRLLKDACKDRDDAVITNFQLSWMSKKYDTFANLVYDAGIYLKSTGSDNVSPSGTYHSQKGLSITFYLRQTYRSNGSMSSISIDASMTVAGGMEKYKSIDVANYSDIYKYISAILRDNPKNNLGNSSYAEGGMMVDGGVFDDEGNLIDIKVGDEVVEYRKRFPNAEEKTQIGPKGRVIKIVDAFAKVSFPNDYEENILLRNLKKMAHGGETESEPLGINEPVYFEVYDGNRNNGIIKFNKSGSRILETLLIGNVKAGNRRYMSYFTKNDLKSSLNRDFDVVNEVDEDYVNDRLISYEKSKPADIFVVKYPYPELAKTADTLTIIKGGEQVFDYDPVTKDFTVVSIGLSYPDQIELDDFLEDSKGVSERQYTPELIKVIEVVKENEDISEIVNELKSKGLIQKYQYTMADGGEVDFSKKMEKMRSAYENLDMIVKSKIAMAIGIDNAISIMDTDYVVHPFHLIKGAVSSGLLEIDEINGDLVGSAIQEAERIDEDYRDSGEGIGSSDITYFTKNVLDDAGYKTGFIKNRLTRVDADGNELVIDKYEMKF